MFFVGLLMIYVGLFGLTIPSVFPLQLTTGFADEFDDGVIGSQWNEWIWDPDLWGGVIVTESGGAMMAYCPNPRQSGGLETADKYAMGDGTVIEGQIRSIGSLSSAVLAFGPETHQTSNYRIIYTSSSLIVRRKYSLDSELDIYSGTYTGMNPKIVISGSNVEFYNGASLLITEPYAWDSLDCKCWIWFAASRLIYNSTGEWERFELQLAAPPPTTYTLTAKVEPSAGGSVVKNPNLAEYEEGSSVDVTYYPAADYVFDNWEENGVNAGSANPYTVTMDEDKVLTAHCHYSDGGPDYAELTVKCEEDMDGDEVWSPVVNLKVDIQQGSTLVGSIYTDSNGIATKTDLDAGSYTISASYSGESDSETVTLNIGSNPTVNLYFSSGSPPPTDGFLEWLKQLVDDPFIRQLLTFGGIGFAGIGFILMLAPEKQRFATTPRILV